MCCQFCARQNVLICSVEYLHVYSATTAIHTADVAVCYSTKAMIVSFFFLNWVWLMLHLSLPDLLPSLARERTGYSLKMPKIIRITIILTKWRNKAKRGEVHDGKRSSGANKKEVKGSKSVKNRFIYRVLTQMCGKRQGMPELLQYKFYFNIAPFLFTL